MEQLQFDTRIEDTPEKAHTRDGYGEGLRNAGKKNSHVVALCADLTESTRTNLFAEAFPDRFFQMGVAEQNMASVASGMAAIGKVPFIASYAMFSPGRSWEQIRTTIAYNDSNVKIIGAHAGISVGPDGATHQAIEDIAIMRVMPNMVVLAPADSNEARAMSEWMATVEKPVYMRIGREKTPVVTTPENKFMFGKARSLHVSSDARIAVLSTGTLLYSAYAAARKLETEGVPVSVYHFGTIKPLDVEALAELAKKYDILVTVEEHQRVGGFGSAVAEVVAEQASAAVVRIGVDDTFGQSGTPDELLAYYGLDTESIVEKIKELL